MSEWIKIRISDYYTNAAGEEEYTYVSPQVYEALVNEFRKQAEAERKRDERNRARINYEDGETDDLLFLQQESVEDLVLKEVELQMLRKAMQTLPEVQKERIILYFFEGMTIRQIADFQGVTQKAVWKSIQAAVNYLKKIMN